MNKFLRFENGEQFERFCKTLLSGEYSQLQTFSQPDQGVDSFEPDSGTIFQFYYPEKSPRKDKILTDLAKALKHKDHLKRWILVTPKDPTPAQTSWVTQGIAGTSVTAKIWGETELNKILSKHPAVNDQFFKTETRKAKKKTTSRAGDAEEWQRISHDEAEEIRQLIDELVQEYSRRKRRKTNPSDYSREHVEFRNHFDLSTYDKLHAGQMGKARLYLTQKLYARRQGETQQAARNREIGGIKAIKKALGMSEREYRQKLFQLTAVGSVAEMSPKQRKTVFEEFRRLQGLAEARR